MPIGNITQSVSTIPAPPHRGVDVQTVFVNKQEDFQDHLADTTIDELNTFKAQLNTRIGEINSTVTTMNGYADTASAGASTATTKAGEASTSASQALTYKNQARTSATEAATSAASLTPSGILTNLKTVDGTGSGLDADLLDGKHSNEFMYQQDFGNNVNLNTLFQSGSYHIGAANQNSPSGSDYGNVLVVRGSADTAAQIVMSPDSSNIFWRGGSGSGGIWQPWKRILSDGNALTTTPLGYVSALGVGGTAVQGSFKTDTVYLNKLTGQITMSNSAIPANSYITFELSNSYIGANDTVEAIIKGGVLDAAKYHIEPIYIQNASVLFKVENKTSSSLSEAIVFNFKITKGAIS